MAQAWGGAQCSVLRPRSVAACRELRSLPAVPSPPPVQQEQGRQDAANVRRSLLRNLVLALWPRMNSSAQVAEGTLCHLVQD